MPNESSISSCASVAGADLCNTLVLQGATDAQLLSVGNGCLDAATLMGVLSGVNTAPYQVCSASNVGTPVADTSSYPIIPQSSYLDQLFGQTYETGQTIASYWPLVAAAIVVILILVIAIR